MTAFGSADQRRNTSERPAVVTGIQHQTHAAFRQCCYAKQDGGEPDAKSDYSHFTGTVDTRECECVARRRAKQACICKYAELRAFTTEIRNEVIPKSVL